MNARFEFLPDETTKATETVIVDADLIQNTNGWIIATKNEAVVFAANEKYIKYVWLYKNNP